jgi:hypothetical protein
LTTDAGKAVIAVPTADVASLQNFLYDRGIPVAVSYDPWTGAARIDVSAVGAEWARDALRHWRG